MKNWPPNYREIYSLIQRLFSLSLPCLFLANCTLPQSGPSTHDLHEVLRLVDQGTLSLRKGDLTQAQAAFEVATEITPSAPALDGLGCVAFLRGEAQKAEDYFIRSMQVDANYMQALGNLALLYESRGLYNKAEQLYKHAIKKDPENFRARNNFAGFLLDIKKDELARHQAGGELRKALALTPHPLVQDNLTRVGNYE